MIGWLQDVPWFYISVGVILSGAGIMTWLVMLDDWKSRNRVEDKLAFGNMRIHLTQMKDRVAAVRFGLLMHNSAAFTIAYRIESIQTKLTFHNGKESVCPPTIPFTSKVFSVTPGGRGWFDDHNIILPSGFQGDVIAEMKCEVAYGKADRFDHKLELNKRTQINFLGPGISGGQFWYDQ